jgi:signal transduction histidine kinase
MIPFLMVIIVALTTLIYMLYRAKSMRSRHLAYIHRKLNEITSNDTSQRLLLFTDHREIQTLLIDLNRVLEHNDKLRANYKRTEISIKKMLANMSHDLKTPLTVVLGLSETIVNDRNLNGEEKERLVSKVHDKAQEMLNLMNTFFDLAKLESGDQLLPLTQINLSAICKSNVLYFYENIVSKGLEPSIDIPEEPVFIIGNEEALNRILNNLLSNAIHYGSDGKVVGITLRFNDEHVYIDIWDRGKGIGEQHQELIFERLYTLEDSRNRLYQGSGLGLTITKRLVEKMGGFIFLQSTPYEKTVFTIRFKKIRR